MSANVPDWLAPPRPSAGLPDWLTAHPLPELVPTSAEHKGLLFAQFEVVFPRVMDMIAGGYRLDLAIAELPIEIDGKGFATWINRSSERREIYKQAKEVRAEIWADQIVKHALGEEVGAMNDVARSRLIVDTYWKLMGSDNRKQYGDTKQIEVTQNISITAALEQARNRVAGVIDLSEDDYEIVDSPVRQIGAAEDDE